MVVFDFMVFGMVNNKYVLEINVLNLFGDFYLIVEVVGVYYFDYDKGQVFDLDSSEFMRDLIWEKDNIGDVILFKVNIDGLLIDLNMVNLKWVMKSLLKMYIVVFQIFFNEIIYSDFVSRQNLSNVIKDIILRKYKSLGDVIIFDFGDFFESNFYRFYFINVYLKFYGIIFDMVICLNMRFIFGDDGVGIMGESVF